MQSLRDPAVRTAAVGALLWALAVVVAGTVAVLDLPAVGLLAVLAIYVGDALVQAGDPRVAAWLADREMAPLQRAMLRDAVAVLAWLLATAPPAPVVTLVVLTVLAVPAAHLGYRVLTSHHASVRRGRIAWRNLDVDGEREGPLRLPPILPAIGPLRGRVVLLASDVFVVLGLWGVVAGAGDVVLVVGAVLTLLALLACLAAGVRRSLAVRHLPSARQDNARLRTALEEYAPEVVVYFSGPVGTTYQLNVWLEALERVRRRVLVVIRERHHLEDLLPSTLPLVVTTSATQVEYVHTDSVLVALYPTTVIRNNHMIRLPGVRHVFINHGDGDKAVTYSPLHRVFDEIWVAGQAACDRYLTKGEGVRPDQLLVVGRPQLAHVALRPAQPATDQVTVLYAPTWEGNFDDVDYSSVASMGVELVRELLRAEPPIRVLFKPHPATGNRRSDAAAGRAQVTEMVRRSPRGVLVGPGPEALYDAFNTCDVLVADVSSVVADFLASRKPYVVTNPRGLDPETMQHDFPSTSGGPLLARGSGRVVEEVRAAVTTDPLRERRERLATYFLGEPSADPVGVFADEVDAACLRAAARHDHALQAGREGAR
ncbi:CDP-glycerol glycerophosphotransferase family protein [Phycicoccus avicenniae]|uniref:CDP-glycerol glycerophosphotransferase family protein n=1 Tax=Phycicoccus avicenniae TaxID=2828860 RepID=UPI003D2AFE56